jgi:hypothetical protein
MQQEVWPVSVGKDGKIKSASLLSYMNNSFSETYNQLRTCNNIINACAVQARKEETKVANVNSGTRN